MIFAKDIMITKHKHTVSDVYYPTYFVDQGGRKHKVMFTVKEIDDAQHRARNKEIKLKPWWKLW